MVTPPHRDDHHNQTLINHFIDQAIPGITKLDFVGILQITVQLCGRNVRSLQPLGQLLFELCLDGAVKLAPLFECGFIKFEFIGLQATP